MKKEVQSVVETINYSQGEYTLVACVTNGNQCTFKFYRKGGANGFYEPSCFNKDAVNQYIELLTALCKTLN